jgi:hypothetical protein
VASLTGIKDVAGIVIIFLIKFRVDRAHYGTLWIDVCAHIFILRFAEKLSLSHTVDDILVSSFESIFAIIIVAVLREEETGEEGG